MLASSILGTVQDISEGLAEADPAVIAATAWSEEVLGELLVTQKPLAILLLVVDPLIVNVDDMVVFRWVYVVPTSNAKFLIHVPTAAPASFDAMSKVALLSAKVVDVVHAEDVQSSTFCIVTL